MHSNRRLPRPPGRGSFGSRGDALNPPKEDQSLDSDGGDVVQYQQRKRRDDEKPRKRSVYNEAESLFMQWAKGSARIGEVKRFTRGGKHRYYEKTENGCVELSISQFNERNGRDAEKDYARIQRQVNGAANSNGNAEGNLRRGLDSYTDTRRTSAVSGKVIGEELRDDARRSVSGIGRRSSGTAITDTDDTQYQRRQTP